MKKIVLSILVVGALVATSCKGEKTNVKNVTKEVVTEVKKEAVEKMDEVKKEVASVLDGISIPSFSNTAVTENLTQYAAYAKDYIAANGNVAKIAGMAKKGADLLAKGKELASKLDMKEMASYKSVLSAIQAKMAPAK